MSRMFSCLVKTGVFHSGDPSIGLTRDIFSFEEWKLAMELIQELSHSRIQPSVICCNALLTAYANSTLWERALHLFLHMEKELRADDVSLGAWSAPTPV